MSFIKLEKQCNDTIKSMVSRVSTITDRVWACFLLNG